MKRFLALISTLFFFLPSYASHIVGGEMDYEYLGNNNYRIHLRVYRDCNSTGAPFDSQAAITVRNSSGTIFLNLAIPHGSIIKLPVTVNNPCLQSPPNICTEYTDYYETVTLPPIAGGYSITYQRCCRNVTIANIPNPGDWGITLTMNIPSNDTRGNSSPSFKNIPPIVMCLNDPLNIDASVNEIDGDSVYYELCSPLHGGGPQLTPSNCQSCTAPNPASAPPYTNVPFLFPSSASNPIPSSPSISIDPSTGLITGKPIQMGQYAFAICVSEFNNGVLQSTLRRDYQFNVTNCQSNIVSGIQSQIQTPSSICAGKTVQFFESATNANSYFWDFGDPNSTSDTSNLPNPVYTYSDTGTYIVTLVVNPRTPCTDTATTLFTVHYPINFTVSYNGNGCFDEQGFTFTIAGSFSPDAQYEWTFPTGANINSFNGISPPPISFNAIGSYPYTLKITDFGCESTFTDTIEVTPRPIFSAVPPNGTYCVPFELDLQEQYTASMPVSYAWDFGDGTFSTYYNPQKVYTLPGKYSGSLLLYTQEGCIDSALYEFEIELLPSAEVQLHVSPSKTDIFYPYVDVKITDIDPGETFAVSMGDGSNYINQASFRHKYSDTGWYEIKVEANNAYGCGINQHFLFRVTPIPLIYVPDAFTPNGDGLNDQFRSFSSGYSQFNFEVFDRWGNEVFRSNDAYEWWDGINQANGKKSPEGTYVWTIEFRTTEGELIRRTGTVTLLR